MVSTRRSQDLKPAAVSRTRQSSDRSVDNVSPKPSTVTKKTRRSSIIKEEEETGAATTTTTPQKSKINQTKDEIINPSTPRRSRRLSNSIDEVVLPTKPASTRTSKRRLSATLSDLTETVIDVESDKSNKQPFVKLVQIENTEVSSPRSKRSRRSVQIPSIITEEEKTLDILQEPNDPKNQATPVKKTTEHESPKQEVKNNKSITPEYKNITKVEQNKLSNKQDEINENISTKVDNCQLENSNNVNEITKDKIMEGTNCKSDNEDDEDRLVLILDSDSEEDRSSSNKLVATPCKEMNTDGQIQTQDDSSLSTTTTITVVDNSEAPCDATESSDNCNDAAEETTSTILQNVTKSKNNISDTDANINIDSEKGTTLNNNDICSIDKSADYIAPYNKPKYQVLEINSHKMEGLKNVPRGIPKSGRWWKTEKNRFSSVIKVKPLRTSWAKKMHLKNSRKEILAAVAEIKEEKKQKWADLKERQKSNEVKKAENAKKSEIVQVINDSRKIKKMKRKQLRMIEKRDTNGYNK